VHKSWWLIYSQFTMHGQKNIKQGNVIWNFKWFTTMHWWRFIVTNTTKSVYTETYIYYIQTAWPATCFGHLLWPSSGRCTAQPAHTPPPPPPLGWCHHTQRINTQLNANNLSVFYISTQILNFYLKLNVLYL